MIATHRSDQVYARSGIHGFLWSARKIAGIVWLFAVVGPPVGGVTWVVTVWTVNFGALVASGHANLEAIAKLLQTFLVVLIFAIPMSYRIGILPALLAGVIIGTAQIRYGRLPWPVVLLIGAAGGLAFQFSVRLLLLLAFDPKVPTSLFPVVLNFVTCTVSTFVCWGLVKNWYADHSASERHSP